MTIDVIEWRRAIDRRLRHQQDDVAAPAKSARSAAESPAQMSDTPDHVASDLAALLWKGIGSAPSVTR